MIKIQDKEGIHEATFRLSKACRPRLFIEAHQLLASHTYGEDGLDIGKGAAGDICQDKQSPVHFKMPSLHTHQCSAATIAGTGW